MTNFIERFGPWAVVTGASSGIGTELARQLHAKGIQLVLAGRDQARLESLQRELAGSKVVAGDLTRLQDLEALIALMDSLEIGLVIANAGFGTLGELDQAEPEQEINMLRLNCEVSLRLAIWAGKRFVPARRGGLVLLSSILGWQGVARRAHYAATKGYIQNLAEGLSEDWASSGVSVLSAAPGPVATAFDASNVSTIKNSDNAVEVARDILAAIGSKSVVVPGRRGRFLTALLATAPRKLRVKILSSVMRKSYPQ